jgi:hypothetical protein
VVGRVVPEEVLLAVGLDESDPLGAASRQPQVIEGHLVDGEEPARRAVLGRHVAERRAVGEWQRADSFAEILDELSDDTRLSEDLRHREDEVGRGRAFAQRAAQLETHHLRDEHRERLSEHRSLGLDPADTPAEDSEPVDHRRVGVGADERVGERSAVALLDDAGEVLEVDLVADPGPRRHDLQA